MKQALWYTDLRRNAIAERATGSCPVALPEINKQCDQDPDSDFDDSGHINQISTRPSSTFD